MTASFLHALLFALSSVLILISDKPILNGPAGIPIVILFVADIPISLVASGRLYFHDEHAKLVWVAWGASGTIWWYLLGISIEAWIKRFKKKHQDPNHSTRAK